jgi:hypothetical protein
MLALRARRAARKRGPSAPTARVINRPGDRRPELSLPD